MLLYKINHHCPNTEPWGTPQALLHNPVVFDSSWNKVQRGWTKICVSVSAGCWTHHLPSGLFISSALKCQIISPSLFSFLILSTLFLSIFVHILIFDSLCLSLHFCTQRSRLIFWPLQASAHDLWWDLYARMKAFLMRAYLGIWISGKETRYYIICVEFVMFHEPFSSTISLCRVQPLSILSISV